MMQPCRPSPLTHQRNTLSFSLFDTRGICEYRHACVVTCIGMRAWLRVSACGYVYRHAWYVVTCIGMRACLRVSTCVRAYVYRHMCVLTCIGMRTWLRVLACVYVTIWLRVSACVCAYVYRHVCVLTCIGMRVSILDLDPDTDTDPNRSADPSREPNFGPHPSA